MFDLTRPYHFVRARALLAMGDRKAATTELEKAEAVGETRETRVLRRALGG